MNGHVLSAPNDLVFDKAGRLLLHRSRQALRAASRPWRRLLRAARRLEGRRARLSDPEPERLRPVAGRQDDLRRRHRRRAAVGVRCRGTGRDQAEKRVRAAQRPGDRRPRRQRALRQPRGDGERQYRVATLTTGYITEISPGRRHRSRGEDAGYLSDQYLLRRAGHAHGLHHPVRHRPAWASCSGRSRG